MSWLGYADAADLAQAQEAARNEARRAKEEQERADRERRNADEVRKQASESESRAKVAEEQARKESHRAKEEKERAEQERKAAAKAKEEAATSTIRAEQAEEQAQMENQRANEEKELAEQERKAAAKAKEEAATSTIRAEQAEEQAQMENQRANEEKELAEQEREAAAKAKEEAAASASRAEQAEEQAQMENQRVKEAQTIAEEARAHAEKEARISEEMRQKKESAEKEKQRLLEEKDEKERREENLMQFAWGPKKTERGRWTSQEVEHLRNQFLEHMYDKEWKLIRGKILIFGPSGAGKSSFCNGLRSALKDSATPANYYAVGNLDESLTSSFQSTQYGDHWIIDMPGIFESNDLKTENIEAIVSGRVRFDAPITKRLDVTGNLPEARRDVSCVVLVLHHGITVGDEVKRQIDAVIRMGGDGALSYHLVMTHLDECDPQFKDPDNLPNLYTSPLVQEAVKNVSEDTGIPPYSISYVKNYVTETETDTNTKLLHLRALDRILTSAADQVEKMIDSKLQKKMYEYAPDTEETQAVSEDNAEPLQDESVTWAIPVLISSGIVLGAAIYMFAILL